VGINPDKVVYAINCGSKDEITDVVGITYKPVKYSDLLYLGSRIYGRSCLRRWGWLIVGAS